MTTVFHARLYGRSTINAIMPFIFNIHHLFHMLLLDFLSIIHTYFHHLTSIFKTTNLNDIFFLPNCLAILINSQPSWHKSAFSTACQAFWSLAIYTTLLVSFFASQYLFLFSSYWLCFQNLNNSLFLDIATSTSLFHHDVSKCLGLPGFLFKWHQSSLATHLLIFFLNTISINRGECWLTISSPGITFTYLTLILYLLFT